MCFRCDKLSHYANECPNPRKEERYTPVCGNCRQMGHIVKECNVKPRNFPPSERDYKENQPNLPPKNSRDVNYITQHMLFEQDVFATRAGTQFRKVIEESDQKSEPESNLQGPKKRKDIIFSNPISVDELDMLKEKSQIPNPTVSPQIPPNIPNMVEKTINNQ